MKTIQIKHFVAMAFVLALVITGSKSYAQQDRGYSMYMFNMLEINPAYAGSREQISLINLYRHQWAGFEGAPRVVTLSGHAPLKKDRIALGFSFTNDRVGVSTMNEVAFDYAYRIPIGAGKLSLGLRANIRNYVVKWTDLEIVDEEDEAFAQDSRVYWRPNFGPGVFYYTEQFYAGFSIPHLINNSLNRDWELAGTQEVAREYRHVFLNSGVVIPISQEVKFKPSAMLKYVANTPVQADINASFLFFDQLWVGASYRTGHTVIGMIEYYFADHFRAGYAYDYELTDVQNHTWGTHELMLGYEFGISSERYLTPRKMNYF